MAPLKIGIKAWQNSVKKIAVRTCETKLMTDIFAKQTKIRQVRMAFTFSPFEKKFTIFYVCWLIDFMLPRVLSVSSERI